MARVFTDNVILKIAKDLCPIERNKLFTVLRPLWVESNKYFPCKDDSSACPLRRYSRERKLYLPCLLHAERIGCSLAGTGLSWIFRRNAENEIALEILKHEEKRKGRLSYRDANIFASLGLPCLVYLWENGYRPVESQRQMAIYGDTDCLKYMHDSGVLFMDDIMITSVHGGNLDCFKYLHEIGCRWDESTTAECALTGHLDMLKYSHENGCPWDCRTTVLSLLFENKECFCYAVAMGCPVCDFCKSLLARDKRGDCAFFPCMLHMQDKNHF